MKKYFTRSNIIGSIILISFVFLSLIFGKHHEPWADEAQSWLIARDSSFSEIITERARYEGSPCLWHFILKIFIVLGLKYNKLFIVPIIFSSLGVFILEFKLEIPKYIKVILPFTYYIFYQYTIVARSYCLVFPVLCFVALLYKRKIKNPYIYCLSLMLLSSICLHTLILSGFLVLLYIYDYILYYKFSKNKKNFYNNIISSIIICFFFLFTVNYVFPAKDVSFTYKKYSFLEVILKGIFIISNALSSTDISIFGCLLGFEIFSILIILLCDTIEKKMKIFLIVIPIILFLSIFYSNEWHIGIVFLALLLAIYINYMENKIIDYLKKKAVINILICFVLIIQVIWSTYSSLYDYNNNYSAAYDTANFIKKNNYENKVIYGLGYSVTAIQPYFEKNIFKNYNSNKAYYFWSINKKYMSNQEIINNMPDVVIISDMYKEQFDDIIKIMDQKGYQKKFFIGSTYIKMKKYESESFFIYVKNN